jgi:hypothetical protein
MPPEVRTFREGLVYFSLKYRSSMAVSTARCSLVKAPEKQESDTRRTCWYQYEGAYMESFRQTASERSE